MWRYSSAAWPLTGQRTRGLVRAGREQRGSRANAFTVKYTNTHAESDIILKGLQRPGVLCEECYSQNNGSRCIQDSHLCEHFL